MNEQHASIADRIWGFFPATPFCFMGLAVNRVWTENVYFHAPIDYPAQDSISYLLYDGSIALTFIFVALFYKRLAPLCDKRGAMLLPAIFLVICTLINCGSVLFASLSLSVFGYIASILGGVGMALLALLWYEMFACLPPTHVALYYSAGIVIMAFLTELLRSMAFPALAICLVLTPCVIMVWLWRAYKRIPASDLPSKPTGTFTFPWQPVVIVILYTCARGLHLGAYGEGLGIGYQSGTVLAGALIYFEIAVKRDNFDFSFIWKVALAAMVLSAFPFGVEIGIMLLQTGYFLLVTLILVILCNLSYRFGVCAIWLFAIEGAVRLVVNQISLNAGVMLSEIDLQPFPGSVLVNAAIVVIAVLASLVFFSKKNLLASWGVVLKTPPGKDLDLALEKTKLGTRVRELSDQFNLTPREEEVLLLILKGNKPKTIAHELVIEPSTVKTHTKHIYQKFDIHTRGELFELVGIRQQT